jgi:hypothetical protein
MAWIELHQSLIRHPKVLRVAEQLGVPRVAVVGHMAALWCWALDAKPAGGPLTDLDIRAGAEWTSRKDFTEALAIAGFVDKDMEGFWLHDWDEYTGKLREQRELRKKSNRDSQRRRRERMSASSHADVSADIADSQQSTQPNQTIPNQRSDPNHTDSAPKTRARVQPKPFTDADREQMHERYGGVATVNEIDDQIELALAHQAAKKTTRLDLYVGNWLRKEFGGRHGRNGGGAGAAAAASRRTYSGATGPRGMGSGGTGRAASVSEYANDF